MFRLLLFVFFFAFANVCFGQISDDFEFIDHKVRGARHGVSKVIGNDFLYVSHNDAPNPMTSAILVNSLDNSIDTLLTTFSSRSSIQEYPDGSFEIFITGLVDYDIGIPGFFSIESDGNNIQVNSFFNAEDPFGNFDNYRTEQALKVASGAYLFSANDYIFQLNIDGSIDTLEFIESNFFFHQNSNKEVFTFSGSDLYLLTESGSDLISSFDFIIYDIESNADYNDVLTKGKLERWNLDFSEKIASWVLPDEIIRFQQLEVGDSSIIGLIQEDNYFSIKSYEFNGNGTLVYDNEYDGQGIKGIHALNDNKFLLIGSDSLTDIGYNTMFFRNIDVEEEIDYQSRDVSIDSFCLFEFEQDRVFQFLNPENGDSIFRTYYHTELTLSISNQSEYIINLMDIHTEGSLDYWSFFNLEYEFDELQLMPGESYLVRDTVTRAIRLSNLKIGIPGADFRFNNHPNKIAYPNFTAEFENIPFDINLILFPNPTTDILNIELDEDIQSIEIFNALGQLILFKYYGADLSKLDVSRLESGSYFIRLSVKGKDGYAVQQFVKM